MRPGDRHLRHRKQEPNQVDRHDQDAHLNGERGGNVGFTCSVERRDEKEEAER